MNDKELIMLFDRRDEAAITELERKYGNYCRAVAFDVLRMRPMPRNVSTTRS